MNREQRRHPEKFPQPPMLVTPKFIGEGDVTNFEIVSSMPGYTASHPFAVKNDPKLQGKVISNTAL